MAPETRAATDEIHVLRRGIDHFHAFVNAAQLAHGEVVDLKEFFTVLPGDLDPQIEPVVLPEIAFDAEKLRTFAEEFEVAVEAHGFAQTAIRHCFEQVGLTAAVGRNDQVTGRLQAKGSAFVIAEISKNDLLEDQYLRPQGHQQERDLLVGGQRLVVDHHGLFGSAQFDADLFRVQRFQDGYHVAVVKGDGSRFSRVFVVFDVFLGVAGVAVAGVDLKTFGTDLEADTVVVFRGDQRNAADRLQQAVTGHDNLVRQIRHEGFLVFGILVLDDVGHDGETSIGEDDLVPLHQEFHLLDGGVVDLLQEIQGFHGNHLFHDLVGVGVLEDSRVRAFGFGFGRS